MSGLLLVLAVALGVAVLVPMATSFNPRLSDERVWPPPRPGRPHLGARGRAYPLAGERRRRGGAAGGHPKLRPGLPPLPCRRHRSGAGPGAPTGCATLVGTDYGAPVLHDAGTPEDPTDASCE